MNLHNLIEKAEKYRNLGRFDKKSAVSYINDAMYEIAKRQSIQIKETFYGYFGERFKPKAVMIKFHSAKIEPSNNEISIRIFNDGSMNIYMLRDGYWVEATNEDYPDLEEITLEFIGYNKAPLDFNENTVLKFPNEFETSIVYYLRAKMLEEHGQLEETGYFMNQYRNELISKVTFKRDVVSKPSEYSLI